MTQNETVAVERRWAMPTAVSDLQMAFSANVGDLMPAYADIPDRFKNGRDTWVKFQQEWFFHGLRDGGVNPRAGVDPAVAVRHLSAIQGSWEPKHEHKEAAVAFLASLWFTSVTANGKAFGDAVAAGGVQ